jgi:hypothetical protein
MARKARQPAVMRFPPIAKVLVLLGLGLANLTIDQALGVLSPDVCSLVGLA